MTGRARQPALGSRRDTRLSVGGQGQTLRGDHRGPGGPRRKFGVYLSRGATLSPSRDRLQAKRRLGEEEGS